MFPLMTAAGSSPQARGTRRDDFTASACAAVHPRRRGEHTRPPRVRRYPFGSSPQARGTLGYYSYALNVNTVHPRRRGEHSNAIFSTSILFGSSPQARGTQPLSRASRLHARFIPAGAGNTGGRNACPASTSVHPRRRGEHRAVRVTDRDYAGSSPQARGTRPPDGSDARQCRFIPAGAGNTHR